MSELVSSRDGQQRSGLSEAMRFDIASVVPTGHVDSKITKSPALICVATLSKAASTDLRSGDLSLFKGVGTEIM